MAAIAAYMILALVGYVYARALFRPGIAVAIALVVFALEQPLSAGLTYFAEHTTVWNIATGVGFIVLAATVISGKYRFRGAFRPILVAALAFSGYFIWAASWGWADSPRELMMTLAPYIAIQVIVVPLLLQSLPDAVQAFRWTLFLGAAVLVFIVAVPEAIYGGSRLMFRIANEPDRASNPMALADACAFVFLVVAFGPQSSFSWIRGAGRWGIMAGALIAVGLASRGELVAAILAATATLLLAPGRQRATWATVLLILGLSVASISTVTDTLVASRYEPDAVERDMLDRIYRSERMLEIFFSRPEAWFRGLGTSYSSIAIGGYPHNQIVQMLTEGGLIGALLWLALHGSAAWIGIKQLRRSADEVEGQFVMRCAVAFWIYYLVVGLKRGHVLDVYAIASPVLLERCALLVEEWRRAAAQRESVPSETEEAPSVSPTQALALRSQARSTGPS